MKTMTKKVLLLLLLFQVCTFPLFSSTACSIIQDTAREIILRGKLIEEQIERSGITPIRATLAENSILELCFYCSVANLTISISKGDEVVEQRTLSVCSSQMERFDLSTFGKDKYSIVISTLQGTLIYGEFALE